MTRTATKAEWAWAAGLFEGEGSIVYRGDRARLQLRMTDEDVVRRFCSVVGGRVYGPYQYDQDDGSIRKPFWVWTSDRTDPQRVIEHFALWLGKRRLAAAEALLDQGVLF